MTISALIQTYNEERNITHCLASISPYVDEIVVVDMHSTDKTRQLARKYTTKIFQHEYLGYVEPARNFAINKATGDWVFLLDADEVVPEKLGLQLRQLVDKEYTFYRIARKNLIFGKWMKHTGWWPDYQIRFFSKGSVTWQNEIHSVPVTEGKGTDLDAHEEVALLHAHYTSIDQFMDRLHRYTSQEALERLKKNEPFDWKNLILKPNQEFLNRFFMWEGYKDGVHGLALSLLQAFSFLIVELKVWEQEKYADTHPQAFLDQSVQTINQAHSEIMYWYRTKKSEEASVVSRTINKLRARMRV